ncbi:MAG: response regulator, partial [Vicinamibacterales bacterium]
MRHKLLLADDSVTIQRVVQLTFVDEDIEVVTVGDGSQIVDAIRKETPDIVLVDVNMPNKNGYEVAAFVKSGATHDVPVVLLAGAFEPVSEAQAKEAGCDGVLVKPFEPNQVVEKVKELLDSRPAADSARVVEVGPTVSPEESGSSSGSLTQTHEIDSVLSKAFRRYLESEEH